MPHHYPLRSAINTLFVLSSTWFVGFNHAFAPSRTQMTRSFGLSARDGDFDLEAARQQLESLVTTEEQPQQPMMAHETWPSARHIDHHFQDMDDIDPSHYVPATVEMELPPPPPLTSIERERRLAEIQLLEQLLHGDDALADLSTLWSQERGPDAARRLAHVEELAAQGPRKWTDAEDELRALIQEYGVRWAEPVHRLATLLYMQDRLEEAEEMSLAVLAVKPWHYGALSGLVMVYAGQKDPYRARQWAAHRLPSFCQEGLNRRRFTWVQAAVAQVRESLEESKDRLREAFGAPDEHITTPPGHHQVLEDDGNDDDAWQ